MCEGRKAPLSGRGAVPKMKRGTVLLKEGQMVGAEQGTAGLTEVRGVGRIAWYVPAHSWFSMTFH